MKRLASFVLSLFIGFSYVFSAPSVMDDAEVAPTRRPVDNQHPMWLIHVDVWNKADPQKIINLIPTKIRPYVVMNLSLSCGYDTARQVYKMPQNAIPTYKSWASVCQHNGMWFTCQPASGGHTHLHDDDLETFEYFYRQYPNFLGWNFAEQFWGFDEPNDKSSSPQADRLALFAKLVPMAHRYGGFLTISFCGNIWSHGLNPTGMMKRNADLLKACEDYPDAILWLYKYTTSSCFYNNESVTFGPFVAGLAQNYGVRYDNCGWNGTLESIYGENNKHTYPNSAGFGTVIEQTCVNGGAVWDGPELIWTEDFQNLSNTTNSDGYTQRNWGLFPGFRNGWLDMFDKIIDGTMYIPTREEVVEKTKIVVINDVKSSDSYEELYAVWGDLYDGVYKQTDPFNRSNGQWMNNFCYFKKTGRYGAIPMVNELYDEKAKSIPVQVKKSSRTISWPSQYDKVNDFNSQYPQVSEGDLYVNRYRNQLVTYFPYSYANKKKNASARIPLRYNSCDTLLLNYGLLSSGVVHEYADRVELYLNNYRSDSTVEYVDCISVVGALEEPTYKTTRRALGSMSSVTKNWDAATGTFKLEIKHNGGVDVKIYCAGKRTDLASDSVSYAALPQPKQPEAYSGPITIEAEDMNYKNITSCVTDPYTWYPKVFGHAGNGFMDMGNKTTGALHHVIKLSEKRKYRLQIRYTNTDKDATIKLQINGANKTLNCRKTETNQWKKMEAVATLNKGSNNIVIINSSGIGMYIDNITYMPYDLEPEKFLVTMREAEHGKVTVENERAAAGDTVLVNVLPDEGYALIGWNIIHGNVTPDEEGLFIMPEDNVTLQPIFKDVSTVYSLDLNADASSIAVGWRCTQENGEVHQYPNNYTLGARIIAGFGGYQRKGQYWRDGSCEYGRQTKYKLNLEPGNYKLSYVMAAWKSTPRYKARILTSKGAVLKSSESTLATPNAAGITSADLSAAEEHTLEFTIEEQGEYIISFVNMDFLPNLHDEFLLLVCNVKKAPDATDIRESVVGDAEVLGIYGADGKRIDSLQKGLNIIRLENGATRKVFIK